MSFGSGQKAQQQQSLNSTQVLSQSKRGPSVPKQAKGGPEVAMIPISEEEVTRDTSNNH
jgi:hypothetical protein